METATSSNKLARSTDDRVVAGVAGGLAGYLEVDPGWVRGGFAVACLFWGIGLLVYALLWITLPEHIEDDFDEPRAPLATENPRAVGGIVLLTFGLLIILWKVLDFLFARVFSHLSFGLVLALVLVGGGLFLLFHRRS